MKRTKLAFLVLSAMLIVTGCKEKEQDLLNKDDPVTIEVWHYYNGAQQDEFNRLVREFNKTVGKEKGIVVEGSGQGTISELEANVLDAIQGKAGADQMPNMFAAYGDAAYEVDQLGYAVDLKPYFTVCRGIYYRGKFFGRRLTKDFSGGEVGRITNVK